jgi:hypothetical protein
MYTGKACMQTRHLALPPPKRSRVDCAPNPTDATASIDDAILQQPNKFAPRLMEMGFKDEQIRILSYDGLTYVEVLDKMLEPGTLTSLRPHTRTHLLVRPTALTIHEHVLARWPQNGGKYAGRIAAIHGDILPITNKTSFTETYVIRQEFWRRAQSDIRTGGGGGGLVTCKPCGQCSGSTAPFFMRPCTIHR